MRGFPCLRLLAAGLAWGTSIEAAEPSRPNVGSDSGGAVGPYSPPHPFAGTIQSVVIEVDNGQGLRP